MSKTTAGYLNGMLTLTFPGAEPVEIGSVSLPVGVTGSRVPGRDGLLAALDREIDNHPRPTEENQ